MQHLPGICRLYIKQNKTETFPRQGLWILCTSEFRCMLIKQKRSTNCPPAPLFSEEWATFFQSPYCQCVHWWVSYVDNVHPSKCWYQQRPINELSKIPRSGGFLDATHTFSCYGWYNTCSEPCSRVWPTDVICLTKEALGGKFSFVHLKMTSINPHKSRF